MAVCASRAELSRQQQEADVAKGDREQYRAMAAQTEQALHALEGVFDRFKASAAVAEQESRVRDSATSDDAPAPRLTLRMAAPPQARAIARTADNAPGLGGEAG